jgi:hypothetical protein
MNAALTAQQLDQQQGARLKRTRQKVNRKIPSRKKLGVTAIEHQIWLDRMHQPPTANNANNSTHLNQTPLTSLIIKQPHPLSTIITLKSNKCLRKPDWPANTQHVSEAIHLACCWLFAKSNSLMI